MMLSCFFAALLVENGKFLLSAKRTRRTTCTEYVISMDADNISRSSSTYIGKLRWALQDIVCPWLFSQLEISMDLTLSCGSVPCYPTFLCCKPGQMELLSLFCLMTLGGLFGALPKPFPGLHLNPLHPPPFSQFKGKVRQRPWFCILLKDAV